MFFTIFLVKHLSKMFINSDLLDLHLHSKHSFSLDVTCTMFMGVT